MKDDILSYFVPVSNLIRKPDKEELIINKKIAKDVFTEKKKTEENYNIYLLTQNFFNHQYK